MKKNIICVIVVLVVIGIVAGGYYFLNKQDNTIENDINTTVEKEEEIKDENVDQVDSKSDLDKKYPVEDGFLTTIKGGSTEEEVIENNILLEESNVPVEDRLEAKRVAENFVQALAKLSDAENEKYRKIASKYVVDDLKKLIDNYLVDGSYEDQKVKITEVWTEECRNEDENDYLYFRVVVSRNLIDKYGQESKDESKNKLVKLLKIDGKYKVVNFKQD